MSYRGFCEISEGLSIPTCPHLNAPLLSIEYSMQYRCQDYTKHCCVSSWLRILIDLFAMLLHGEIVSTPFLLIKKLMKNIAREKSGY